MYALRHTETKALMCVRTNEEGKEYLSPVEEFSNDIVWVVTGKPMAFRVSETASEFGDYSSPLNNYVGYLEVVQLGVM